MYCTKILCVPFRLDWEEVILGRILSANSIVLFFFLAFEIFIESTVY